jgi:hypothetical protein
MNKIGRRIVPARWGNNQRFTETALQKPWCHPPGFLFL